MAKLLSVRLDERLLDEIDQAGQAERRGRSEVVREALELWLSRRRTAARASKHRDGYARRPVADDEFEPVLGGQRWPK